MREIKFRVWDKIERKMQSWESLCRQAFLISVLENDDIYFVPMQFTGLVDKNGKEIYEGDILKTSTGNHQVIWDEDGLWGFDSRHPLYFADIQQREVIGNLYDHPELLKP